MVASRADLSPSVRELYPFEGERFTLRSGHSLHVVDEGRGDVLLMLHGNPTWSFYYRNLIRGLAPQARCVAVDHLGCGLSDKPQDWSYHIGDHVENVLELIRAKDLRDITLVAHDWGGPIGYLAALADSERFSRFVVFNSGVFLVPLPKLLTMFRLPGYGAVVVRGLNGFLRFGLRFATGDRARFQGAVRDGYLAPYGSWHDRIAVLRFVEEIPLTSEHHNQPLLGLLDRSVHKLSDRPHLVVWGKQDWVFHDGYLQRWRETFPAAEVHEVDGASHWVVEEAHEQILPWMKDFLARHPIKAPPA